MATDKSKSWREGRVGQIHLEQSERASKMRELRAEMQRLEALGTSLAQKLFRAQRFDINEGICPRCAIDNAKRIQLIAFPTAAIAVGEQQENVDMLRCPECGWDEITSS